jgi:hypothetical protein
MVLLPRSRVAIPEHSVGTEVHVIMCIAHPVLRLVLTQNFLRIALIECYFTESDIARFIETNGK